MRIFLADDQAKVCSALRLLLEHEPGLYVVGETEKAGELLAQVKITRPDLMLLDWELPGLALANAVGSEKPLLTALHTHYPDLKVIAMSGQLEARQAALAAGVDAFISKGEPPERLLTTLRTIDVEQKIAVE